ncbi:ABC transporter ATP-binding protein [Candidatus Kaiserbacteria bacterium]|nr:ABC transporter ATP-binding protein [Candidatus Kaiserbacteria bacterium]
MVARWREDIPLDTNPFRFFLFISKAHWRVAVVSMLAVIAAGLCAAYTAYTFKLIANAALALPQESAYQNLLWGSGLYLASLLAAKAFWRLSGFVGAEWATGSRASARHALTAYVTLHSRTYFSNRFAGSIANKIGHASSGMVDMVELLLWEFMELFVAVITSFFIAFFASPSIALIFLVWVIVVAVLNSYFAYKRTPLSAKAQQLETSLTGKTVDLLSNITAMQEYARRPFEIVRLKDAIDERRLAGLRNWWYGERVLVINNVLQTFFGAAMLYTAIKLAMLGSISPGDVVLIITIIFRIEGLLQTLGSNLNKVSNVWGEIEESLNEIVEPHEIPDREDAIDLVVSEGKIDVNTISFAYEETQVFQHLSIHVEAGQRVGLVGRSGSGKSTLMRLLLHHHDIQGGSITIDDTDIAGVKQESLRRAISIVPQEPLLFHRTVLENIGYGKPNAKKKDIVEAAELAQAHEFIENLPQGYNSVVGERGIKLSGGERQRVVIARAILKNAPILLLDEATSALDSESEVAIQEALKKLMQGKTVIAIAHRLSTLREMDRLLVMEKGKIIEDGTHDELLRKGGKYSDLWTHQAGGFLQDDE